MVATDLQAPQQKQAFKGLLDLLMEDEKKKALIRQKAQSVGAASAQIAQPFAVQQPQALGFSGGLLQQPQIPAMVSGQGIMGAQPDNGDGANKKEMIFKMMKYLGMA